MEEWAESNHGRGNALGFSAQWRHDYLGGFPNGVRHGPLTRATHQGPAYLPEAVGTQLRRYL